MPSPAAERWTLTFRPTGAGPPTEIRIRKLLKLALRCLGLRCIDFRKEP
jgi:hypothetical protein